MVPVFGTASRVRTSLNAAVSRRGVSLLYIQMYSVKGQRASCDIFNCTHV